jgi:hypothetical protein
VSDPANRRRSLRSFLAGSMLGGVLVLVARRRRPPGTGVPPGLAAFESAPCARAGPDGRTEDDRR